MKLPFSQRTMSSIGVIALVVMLGVLALLQYRWSRDVSEAAGARMRASLQSSMVRFREDFSRELASLALAVQSDSDSPLDSNTLPDFVQRLETWKRSSAHPELLQGIYIFDKVNGRDRLRRFNSNNGELETVEWPDRLSGIRDTLTAFPFDMPFYERLRVARPADRAFRPARPARSAPSIGPTGAPFLERARIRLPWMFDENDSILLHLQMDREQGNKSQPSSRAAWILIELNDSVIREQVLPQLAQAHFSGSEGLEYDVAVVDRSHDNQVVYSSNANVASIEKRNDAAVPLVGGFGPAAGGPFVTAPGPGPITAGPGLTAVAPAGGLQHFELHNEHGEFEARRPIFFGPIRVERFRFGDRGPGWELLAKHRKGSLESALASMHHRQLAMSFGVLLLLAFTIAMIVVATRRAQRLAKLQMDFVTGVSHELRTPLAVIGSAAENIADGIIDDKNKLKRYGTVIRDQSRQLTQLVEQILLFASTSQGRRQYNLSRVAPAEFLKLAMENSSELICRAGFTVEEDIAPDLPTVMADVAAVSHCLQNLIANAVKYSGESRWLRISAHVVKQAEGEELQVAVEDKGIGIAKSDLQRIFDPFYRSPAVASAQIHGTGLGLALARNIAEAMNGSLSATSELGKGSCFILHLPCASQAENQGSSTESTETDTIYYESERSNR